jgi:hypothetical protein
MAGAICSSGEKIMKFMKRALWILVAATLLAVTTAMASAQQFDPRIYQQMVDASSLQTIPPGTKITLHNWSEYKNFFPYFVQLALQGGSHFHVIDSPEYVVEVGPTQDYPIPKAMRQDTEKYAGQTRLLPYPATGGFIRLPGGDSIPESNRAEQGCQDNVQPLGRFLSAIRAS